MSTTLSTGTVCGQKIVLITYNGENWKESRFIYAARISGRCTVVRNKYDGQFYLLPPNQNPCDGDEAIGNVTI